MLRKKIYIVVSVNQSENNILLCGENNISNLMRKSCSIISNKVHVDHATWQREKEKSRKGIDRVRQKKKIITDEKSFPYILYMRFIID